MTVSGPGTPEPRPSDPGVRTESPVASPLSHMRLRTWAPSPYSSSSRDSAETRLFSQSRCSTHRLFSLFLSPQASSAEQLRKEGNELFKCGDYEGALTAYTQALSLGATPQDQAILHRNRAACHLKLVRGSGCSNLVLPGPGIAHSPCCLRTSWAFPRHARLPEVFRYG